ncbi:MAG: xanthine dehydrogenase family protein molybdopterin-binding subunit [Rhodobacteraceae bacterium]|nr:xanthine dehydrogenase family protein molybdopterin-binding subunit [Paracoccaceae bacterium]
MWKIGRSQTRLEDASLVTGAGCYTNDRRDPEGLVMVLLRSQTAAAKLNAVDVEGARSLPGVVDILLGSEQARDGIGPIVPRVDRPGPHGRAMLLPDVRPLATERLQYVGHPIAAIVAETAEVAEAAAEMITVDCDEGDPVVDPIAALAPGAPRVWLDLPDNHCFRVEKGDGQAVRLALDAAHHVTRARLRISRVTAVALEPRAAIASHDAVMGYRLDIGTQTPHRVATDLSKVLGIDPCEIRVVSKDTGGSFGMKNSGYPEYAIALWAARRTGRKINWVSDRLESFLSDAHARDQWVDAAIAIDDAGLILGLDVHITAGLGACMGPASTHPSVANLAGLAGVYRTPAIHVVVDGVFTNCQQVAPYRGAGRPEATYIIERMIDIAAAEAGFDRVELRRKNMIPTEAMPYETSLGWVYDCGAFETVMDRALEAADWAGFSERRKASAARGMLRGIGIANPIEIAGGPAKAPHGEFASVRVARQGNMRIVVGSCDTGQGHATAFRQIASDRLGVDPTAIEVVSGDTREVAQGTGTFGSRSVSAAGTALWSSMSQLIAELRPHAAEILKCDEDVLGFERGAYRAPSGKCVPFLEVRAAVDAPAEAQAFVCADGATFPNGCHICEVVINTDTGVAEVDRYTVVDDVGTVVNPLLVKGQVAGGVAQGVGQALMENIQYEDGSGQLLTASFMDYAIPRSENLPEIVVHSHPVPTLMNPLGAKGAGEAGTVGALAVVISAVSDALAAHGVHHIDMPATPLRIWQALQGTRA